MKVPKVTSVNLIDECQDSPEIIIIFFQKLINLTILNNRPTIVQRRRQFPNKVDVRNPDAQEFRFRIPKLGNHATHLDHFKYKTV